MRGEAAAAAGSVAAHAADAHTSPAAACLQDGCDSSWRCSCLRSVYSALLHSFGDDPEQLAALLQACAAAVAALARRLGGGGSAASQLLLQAAWREVCEEHDALQQGERDRRLLELAHAALGGTTSQEQQQHLLPPEPPGWQWALQLVDADGAAG